MSTKTMTDDAFADAILHEMHVSASSAKESAARVFGRESAAFAKLAALTQLLLALHDEQRDEAERRVAAYFAAIEKETAR